MNRQTHKNSPLHGHPAREPRRGPVVDPKPDADRPESNEDATCEVDDAEGGTVRLQKYLAERGVASRRGAVALIIRGQVRVNDLVVRRRTVVLYKPRGYICSRSETDGRIVYDLLDGITEHLRPIGRLDKDSEGLLLLSNDGDLIERLTHPRYGQTKTYRVSVRGPLTDATIDRLNQPFDLDGTLTRPARVRLVTRRSESDGVLEFVLSEGRNRQIRRMCEICGLDPARLVRVEEAGVTLRGLKPGRWRDVEISAKRFKAPGPTAR
jgi:pseudouridine synthase